VQHPAQVLVTFIAIAMGTKIPLMYLALISISWALHPSGTRQQGLSLAEMQYSAQQQLLFTSAMDIHLPPILAVPEEARVQAYKIVQIAIQHHF
jgi:ABC-type dipeptide/oligopeptide/nickel transport system permease subunit